MQDNATGLHILVLPFGAGINTPHWVAGDRNAAPASLLAFYEVFGTVLVQASVSYIDANHYLYDATIVTASNSVVRVVGSANPNVAEAFRIGDADLSPTLSLGGAPSAIAVALLGSLLVYGGIVGEIRVEGDATLRLSGDDGTGTARGNFVIDNVSQGRGLKSWTASQSSSAALAAETAVLTGNAMTAEFGRAYAVRFGSHNISSAGANRIFRIRKSTVAGAVVIGTIDLSGTIAGWQQAEHVFINATSADIAFTPCLTMAPAGGGTVTQGGFATLERFLRVDDIGAAADFPNAVTLT